jgi:predicted transcriptional regulator
MNTLTLKIPEELDAALQAASQARGVSKSAMVREAIEQALGRQAESAATAERWLAQWRGSLAVPKAAPVAKRRSGVTTAAPKASPAPDDTRVAHILAKHLR